MEKILKILTMLITAVAKQRKGADVAPFFIAFSKGLLLGWPLPSALCYYSSVAAISFTSDFLL